MHERACRDIRIALSRDEKAGSGEGSGSVARHGQSAECSFFLDDEDPLGGWEGKSINVFDIRN